MVVYVPNVRKIYYKAFLQNFKCLYLLWWDIVRENSEIHFYKVINAGQYKEET